MQCLQGNLLLSIPHPHKYLRTSTPPRENQPWNWHQPNVIEHPIVRGPKRSSACQTPKDPRPRVHVLTTQLFRWHGRNYLSIRQIILMLWLICVCTDAAANVQIINQRCIKKVSLCNSHLHTLIQAGILMLSITELHSALRSSGAVWLLFHNCKSAGGWLGRFSHALGLVDKQRL